MSTILLIMTLITSLLSLVAIFSGLLVITANSPIASVLYLIVLFVCSAGILILGGMPYLGIVYIVVYVGAIAILFIFVIMLMDLQKSDITESTYEFNLKLPITLLLAASFFLIMTSTMVETFKNIEWLHISSLFFGTINYWSVTTPSAITSTVVNANSIFAGTLSETISLSNLLQIQAIGTGLYTNYSVLIIFSSFLFLLGMIAPIVLSHVRKSATS